ncbi:hypothetical protein CDD83_11206 [Cordyceps sp. RAO-2017]|nr:hypothetical protein CDD83_11206 [Cordyceps sp. RAO-2017]
MGQELHNLPTSVDGYQLTGRINTYPPKKSYGSYSCQRSRTAAAWATASAATEVTAPTAPEMTVDKGKQPRRLCVEDPMERRQQRANLVSEPDEQRAVTGLVLGNGKNLDLECYAAKNRNADD